MASVASAIVGWWKAAEVERLQGSIAVKVGQKLEATKAALAKDLAANESALRVKAERQLEVFKLAASSAEDAARRLLAWHEKLREFDRETYTTKEALEVHRDRLTELRQAAEASGLFVAPELDAPLATAREALAAAVKAVSLVAIANQHGHDVTVERLDDRSAKLKQADAAVADYAARARAWKAKEWQHESANGAADGT
ncbi:MAG: hypothetical protein IPM35_18345 [Myxococcales bacterium]|nr:hypothetical protein [Myxococcales bacterium]